MIQRPSNPVLTHGRYTHTGPRRTLDEAAIRAEIVELRAKVRTRERAARLATLAQQLSRLQNRSPWK